jgi:hypothetical protein
VPFNYTSSGHLCTGTRLFDAYGETEATIVITATSTFDGTKSGTATVTVTDTSATGTAPGISTTTLSGGTVGTVYSQTLTATGTTPITWSVDGGSLPGGLTLTGDTISGNPTTAGTFSFTVKAENAKGGDIKAFSIVIANAPATPPSTGGGGGGGGSSAAPPASGATSVGDSDVTTPAGQPPVKNADGSTTLPGGGTVETDDGTTVSAPAGTTIGADGTLTIPDGKTADVALPGGVSVTVPGGSTVSPSGTVTLPAAQGAAAETAGGVSAALPGGSVISADGVVSVPASKTATVKTPGGVTITVPGGSTVSLGTDKGGVPLGTAPIAEDTAKDGRTRIYVAAEAQIVFADGSKQAVPAYSTIVIENPDDPLGGINVIPGAAAWQNPFADVKDGDWYYDDVKYVYENGLFEGTGQTAFSPDTTMTRAMLVTVLYRLAHQGTQDGTTIENPFTDVPENAWYTGAVVWAYEKGIVSGVGDSRFAPEANVTREQTATLLYSYAQYAGITLPETTAYTAFADDAGTASYAKDAVAALVKAGIISGKPDNLFDPKGSATRAEVAAVLHRFAVAANGGELR